MLAMPWLGFMSCDMPLWTQCPTEMHLCCVVKNGAQICLIRFSWVSLCCGSFWISKVWISFLVLSQFLSQRWRWMDLKWCGDDTDIILTATVGEADLESWCSLFRTVKLPPWLSSSALLLLGKDQISKREQSSVYGVEWKREQLSSVQQRCHPMPGIPRDSFQKHLTYCPLCPETNPCLLWWKGVSRRVPISTSYRQITFSLWDGLCDTYCMKTIFTSTRVCMKCTCVKSRSNTRTHPNKEQMLSAFRFVFIHNVCK